MYIEIGMALKKITYRAHDVDSTGYIAYPKEINKKTPAILIAHAWRGPNTFVQQKAEELANMGYIAFAADVYGSKHAESDEEAFALMAPLFSDRALLRERIKASYSYLADLADVDSERIGAIGYCFGGLTLLELLRSGSPVKGIVSFHGVLGNKMGPITARHIPNQIAQGRSALFLHGDLDPLVSQDDISDLRKELTESDVDWQFHIFSNTVHGFTNPEAHDVKSGLSYHKKSDQRSWKMMQDFFTELF